MVKIITNASLAGLETAANAYIAGIGVYTSLTSQVFIYVPAHPGGPAVIEYGITITWF